MLRMRKVIRSLLVYLLASAPLVTQDLPRPEIPAGIDRMVMLLCSEVAWYWELEGEESHPIKFRADGTGNHTNTGFRWEIAAGGIKLTIPDGRSATLTLDTKALTLKGIYYDQKTKVVCRAKIKGSR